MKIKQLLAATAIILAQFSMESQALPANGLVQNGNATITTSGKNMTINQTSKRADIDWTSYNIGAGELVEYKHKNSTDITINRVVGGVPTSIAGALKANGRVVVINTSGITITNTGSVNVGALVATTSYTPISDNEDSPNTLAFSRSSKNANKVINNGIITAGYGTPQTGGLVALISPQTTNTGTINAAKGRVDVSGGEFYTVDFAAKGVTYKVPTSKLATILATNTGNINAKSGYVVMNADTATAIAGSTLNLNGVVDASNFSATDKSGFVKASSGGKLNVGGQVQANGTNTTSTSSIALVSASDLVLASTAKLYAKGVDSGHNGGNIVISSTGSRVALAGDIDVSTAKGVNSGLVSVSAKTTLDAAGKITANGDNKTYSTSSGGSYRTPSIMLIADGNVNLASTSNISAKGLLSGDNGGYVYSRSKAGTVTHAGTIDVSTTTGHRAGVVELIANKDLTISGKVYAKGGQFGKGGTIGAKSDTAKITRSSGMVFDASGGTSEGAGGKITFYAGRASQVVGTSGVTMNASPKVSGEDSGVLKYDYGAEADKTLTCDTTGCR